MDEHIKRGARIATISMWISLGGMVVSLSMLAIVLIRLFWH